MRFPGLPGCKKAGSGTEKFALRIAGAGKTVRNPGIGCFCVKCRLLGHPVWAGVVLSEEPVLISDGVTVGICTGTDDEGGERVFRAFCARSAGGFDVRYQAAFRTKTFRQICFSGGA